MRACMGGDESLFIPPAPQQMFVGEGGRDMQQHMRSIKPTRKVTKGRSERAELTLTQGRRPDCPPQEGGPRQLTRA